MEAGFYRKKQKKAGLEEEEKDALMASSKEPSRTVALSSKKV